MCSLSGGDVANRCEHKIKNRLYMAMIWSTSSVRFSGSDLLKSCVKSFCLLTHEAEEEKVEWNISETRYIKL